ncbi:MAG: DNA-3-methyladenine glycosylase [Balneolaceae bacterium]|nr:DNA-3-methyladenine glycosylase [Balneolaceae bacterium]
MCAQKLGDDFYTRDDVVLIARDLIGRVLCTQFEGQPLTSGLIVETEAYSGRNDKACHANNGRKTERTEIMYHRGGVAYVYLCYGIHHLFNVVTNREGQADAVLIRAIKPLEGTESMVERRNAESLKPEVTAGPGRLTQALGITTDHYGTDLTGDLIWIENRDDQPTGDIELVTSPRVGVEYAGDHAKRNWRFTAKDNPWVSK